MDRDWGLIVVAADFGLLTTKSDQPNAIRDECDAEQDRSGQVDQFYPVRSRDQEYAKQKEKSLPSRNSPAREQGHRLDAKADWQQQDSP